MIMVKRLVACLTDPDLLFDLMHELGTSFYCKMGKDAWRVVYFAGNRELHFEGNLTEKQLGRLKENSVEVSEITVNELQGEIQITQ